MTSPSFNDDFEDTSLSTQLQETLRASITTALSTRRPLLTHLNADTTWLLSLPYPEHDALERKKTYFHILIDPWLKGGQSDVAAFFSQQWHKEESSVQSIEEVEAVVEGIEDVARREGEYISAEKKGVPGEQESTSVEDGVMYEDITMGDEDDIANDNEPPKSSINAILISHEFTDHMHKETLLELSPSVPIFATSKAYTIIESWTHFTTVCEIPRFDGDWRNSSTSPLPSWLGFSRVAYAGKDLLYYHSAIMVAFSSSNTPSPEEAEAVLYTPHGISPENITPLTTASPRIHTLALLHGLQDIQIKARFAMEAQLNKGAHNGLKVQRLLKARYWIGTHDEVKVGGGVVSWFLRRGSVSFGEAMERERERERERVLQEGRGEAVVQLADVRFVDLRNGESLVLE